MKSLGYYNGFFAELESMYIPMNDRVCAFGDGIYDAAYCYNHKIFALEEHIDRFYIGLSQLKLNFSMPKEELENLICRLVDRVEDEKLFVYWQATRGTCPREHVYDSGLKANLWIIIKHGELRDMSKPVDVILAEDRRHTYCNVKTLNLLPNIMTAKRVAELNAQEAIFHRNGRITECTHSNVSIIKNGKLITPPSDNLILSGIGRAHLIRSAISLGIDCEEREFYIEDLYDAEEIILTAAGSLCITVGRLDGARVGGKAPALIGVLRASLIKEFNAYTGADIR